MVPQSKSIVAKLLAGVPTMGLWHTHKGCSKVSTADIRGIFIRFSVVAAESIWRGGNQEQISGVPEENLACPQSVFWEPEVAF